jgi:hypothetical protein
MYKAVDVRDNSEIVILNPKWLASIESLRLLGRDDILVCQECKQPVRVRAGDERREHFAHKRLGDCTYEDESPRLREARAVLYQWLVGKFGADVSLEKNIDGANFFRPIDCCVQRENKIFAYWIFDGSLKPEKRDQLQIAIRPDVEVHWVFTFDMLHTKDEQLFVLFLSPTEREFIQHSEYDRINSDGYSDGSLHYLDAERRKLHTYRSLNRIHYPQMYQGFEITSELDRLLVSPATGEFVHLGEREDLIDHRKAQERFWAGQTNDAAETYHHPNQKTQGGQGRVGKCVKCGEETDDWISFDGRTGTCECRKCFGVQRK